MEGVVLPSPTPTPRAPEEVHMVQGFTPANCSGAPTPMLESKQGTAPSCACSLHHQEPTDVPLQQYITGRRGWGHKPLIHPKQTPLGQGQTGQGQMLPSVAGEGKRAFLVNARDASLVSTHDASLVNARDASLMNGRDAFIYGA
eukprot:1159771-Pelagomonas_calceolata.AAC.3